MERSGARLSPLNTIRQVNVGVDEEIPWVFGFAETTCMSFWGAGATWKGVLTNPSTIRVNYTEYGSYTVTGAAVDMTSQSDAIEASLTFSVTSAGGHLCLALTGSLCYNC